MANRVMEQKRLKMLRHRLKGAKKIFPSNYNNTVKVSQGPDVRISEYFERAKGIGRDSGADLLSNAPPAPRPPEPGIKIDDPILQMELKRLFQTDRLQKIHEYYNLAIRGQASRMIKYYFGGGEHFFVQEFPSQGIRRRSVIYHSKEQAMLYYNIPNGIVWEVTQVMRAPPEQSP